MSDDEQIARDYSRYQERMERGKDLLIEALFARSQLRTARHVVARSRRLRWWQRLTFRDPSAHDDIVRYGTEVIKQYEEDLRAAEAAIQEWYEAWEADDGHAW